MCQGVDRVITGCYQAAIQGGQGGMQSGINTEIIVRGNTK